MMLAELPGKNISWIDGCCEFVMFGENVTVSYSDSTRNSNRQVDSYSIIDLVKKAKQGSSTFEILRTLNEHGSMTGWSLQVAVQARCGLNIQSSMNPSYRRRSASMLLGTMFAGQTKRGGELIKISPAGERLLELESLAKKKTDSNSFLEVFPIGSIIGAKPKEENCKKCSGWCSSCHWIKCYFGDETINVVMGVTNRNLVVTNALTGELVEITLSKTKCSHITLI